MGAGIERGYAAEGFGEVSRRVGIVFRYLLLASTLIGLIALAILLALVTYDAVQPQTAEPGWYLTLLMTFVLPSLGVGWWLRRETPRGVTVGAIGAGVPVLGLLFGAGVTMLFIDIVLPVTWLGYALGLALPFGLVVALERQPGLPWTGKLLAVLAAFGASLWFVPGLVIDLPVLPADWLILVLTLGGPAAFIVGGYARRRWRDGQASRLAGGGVLATAIAAAFVGPVIGVTATPATILAVFAVVPAGVYAAVVMLDDPANRPGLLLPVVLIGGLVVGLVATDLLAFAGPQSWVDWQFLTSNHNNDPTQAGV
ncbi:MAG: phosphate ABC transporter, permease protein PstA, partial [Halobacteriales archaeon]